jgi:hypothetical protein
VDRNQKEPFEAVSVSRGGFVRIYVFGMDRVGLETWNQNWIASDYRRQQTINYWKMARNVRKWEPVGNGSNGRGGRK